ncbi:hypothetical protein [Janthinobacterium fluminis]|uniref:ABC-2 type transport system permease protein n=1 Tax=Janthinobacterium fluminis TaxID=2987524 RepID=A0ABT5JZN5_9BURK|nr:hypothetical protein [Janthinobacterium fluminis]MDC8758054.1 hypothetical protein [Janthinobacterium fluminis]
MPPSHPYIAFRLRLARHGLAQCAASLRSTLEIVLPLAGIGLFGLLAMIALPGLYAATLAWPAACAVVLAQALLTAAPAWLLRKRLLPPDVAAWLPALPLPAALRWRADAAVAALLTAPLALAYAVSLSIWLYQWPAWLRPVAPQGIAATLLSLLLSWICAGAVLARRARPAAPARQRRRAAQAGIYTARPQRPRILFLWHRLYWLPFWRGDSAVGIQQSLLWLGAAASALLWLWRPAAVPAPVFGLATTVLLLMLTDRGDQAVRAHIALLRTATAAWPVAARRVACCARLFSLLPALSVQALFGAVLRGLPGGYSHKVAAIYLGAGGMAHLAIVGLPGLNPRARVALVAVSILVLSAIGSELWN